MQNYILAIAGNGPLLRQLQQSYSQFQNIKFYGEIDIQAGISSAKNGGDEKKISANIGGNITANLSLILGLNKALFFIKPS